MQTSPKDYRLFHYTKDISFLSDMLENGIWPRYCVEEFNWLFGNFTCAAFPVVCFCDMPISAAGDHRARYGSYALSISKDRAFIYDICPVWYVKEGTSIQRHLSASVNHPVRPTLDTIPPQIKPILPFLKSTIGVQPDRDSHRFGAPEILAFEEELEWRHTPVSLSSTWKIGYQGDIVSQDDHEASRSSRLILDHADIENVFVRTDGEVVALAKRLPSLAGKISTWP